jgi:hypothetical protein
MYAINIIFGVMYQNVCGTDETSSHSSVEPYYAKLADFQVQYQQYHSSLLNAGSGVAVAIDTRLKLNSNSKSPKV